MTLLEATTTLIDAVKTYAPESDRKVTQAIKRMEKRLFVLLVRQAKARKRARTNAFWDAMATLGGGVSCAPNVDVIPCKGCDAVIDFGTFCKSAEWTGNGRVINLTCPKCGLCMEPTEKAK